MIIIDGQLCPWKYISTPVSEKKKKKDENEVRMSLSGGYIQNQSSIKTICIFWVIKTDLSQ